MTILPHIGWKKKVILWEEDEDQQRGYKVLWSVNNFLYFDLGEELYVYIRFIKKKSLNYVILPFTVC